MEWSLIFSIFIVMLAMFLGEVVSTKTGGRVPQMLIVAIIFLVGFWTVFPKDILNISGITTLSNILISMILINVGTMFSVDNIKKEWKTVIVVIMAMIGILIFDIGVGTVVFGKDSALASAGPMTGGGMAAIIINDAAVKAGQPHLGMLANMIFIMHGFFGFPLTAFFLNRESKRLIKGYHDHTYTYVPVEEETAEAKSGKEPFYEKIPKWMRTNTFYLTQLFFWGWIASLFTNWTGINNAIIQVIMGIILGHFGILESDSISKTQANGILTPALFASFMASFASATVSVVLDMIVTIVVLMIVSTIGLILFSIPIGKKLGFSRDMSIAIGLNCYLGFPFNFALTQEAIKGAASTPEEAAMLNDYLMPKMIISGIVAVSILSAIIAGVLAGILF